MLEAAVQAAANAPWLLLLIVVGVCLAGGVVPGPPIEPVLLGAAVVAPDTLLVPLVVVATVSHMAAKTILYLGGRHADRIVPDKRRAAFQRACERLGSRRGPQLAILFLSAVVGFPPFYLTTLASGALHLPLRLYLLVGTAGRAIRFAALVAAPQLFT